MDGVIFNTEDLYRDAIMTVAAEHGLDIPLDFYLSTIGLPGDATRAVFQDRLGTAFAFDAFWSKAKARFRTMTITHLRLKAGVVELLDVLDEAALPRAIATSSRHDDVPHNLGFHGLRHRFETVIARGDYASGKPHPEPFLMAAERLGVPPQHCVALEDSYHGVKSASAAGMMTIMVPDLFPPTPEVQELCICIAADLHQVRKLITS
jgi:HAD superfamily hydrolase (TIGR01509 family)